MNREICHKQKKAVSLWSILVGCVTAFGINIPGIIELSFEETEDKLRETPKELEKQKLLEQERLKADGILKAEQQAELHKRNRNIVKSHLQLIEK